MDIILLLVLFVVIVLFPLAVGAFLGIGMACLAALTCVVFAIFILFYMLGQEKKH